MSACSVPVICQILYHILTIAALKCDLTFGMASLSSFGILLSHSKNAIDIFLGLC